jgi:hypothetical protein
MVLAGYLANVDKDPACAINLAAIVYPNISVKFGATDLAEILGYTIAARLIAHAGSLSTLAK